MEKHTQYTSLEWACRALKAENPALLSQLAKQMVSIIDPDAVFNPETLRATDPGRPEANLPITYGELSSYLDAATGRYVPVLFETPRFTIESQHVRVNVEWLGREARRARESLGLIEVVQAPVANDAVSIAYRQNASSPEPIDQPPVMTTDGLDHLRSLLAFKNDQRKAQNAASKDREDLIRAEERIRLLEAQVAELAGAKRTLETENASIMLESKAMARRKQEVEVSLDDAHERLAVFSRCFNPHEALFPPELAMAFDCWRDLTHGGKHNPAGPGGRGVHYLVEGWVTQHRLTLNNDQFKRLKALVSWRKKGSGAIRSTK